MKVRTLPIYILSSQFCFLFMCYVLFRCYVSRSRQRWNKLQLGESASGRYPAVNILRRRAGPTAFETSRISNDDQPWIVSLSGVEYQTSWNGCIFGTLARSWRYWIRRLPLRDYWSEKWGSRIFTGSKKISAIWWQKHTIQPCMWWQILSYLGTLGRIHRKLSTCLLSWRKLDYTCRREQLLPCKARCRFLQHIANKIKFWLMVDLAAKYLYNGFPYLGKEEERTSDTSLPTCDETDSTCGWKCPWHHSG